MKMNGVGLKRRRSTRLAAQMKCEPSTSGTSPAAKKKQKVEFLSMNDHCIDEICEWLPLNTLASLGMTCKRLNQITSSYFRRKHPTKSLLMMKYNGEVNLYPDQLYVQCFSETFRNIVIHGNDLKVFQYAVAKFKKSQLKKVCICAANLTMAHIECISGILEHAEIVEFIRCTFSGSLNEILKHCSNMKHLAIKSVTECQDHGRHNAWLLENHPKLKHLHWGQQGTIPIELATFFTNNPNVDSLCGDERFSLFMKQHKIKINELIMKVSYSHSFFENGELDELCEENVVESLYLMGSFRHLDFVSNREVTIHNKIKGICSPYAKSKTILEHFKQLKFIKCDVSSYNQASEMAKQMVNLEEAYIDVKQIDAVVPLIRFAKKLTTIYVSSTSTMKPGNKLNLFNLNKQRKKLAGATDVVVYVTEEVYLKVKNMSVGCFDSLVQFKPIDAFVAKNNFIYTVFNE